MTYNSWEEIFKNLQNKKYFRDLQAFLDKEYENKIIYPPKDEIFNAFKLTDFNNVKVVIFGQDPYPNPGEAMGLAFSVREGIKLPPSLQNIFKEIYNEYEISKDLPKSGDLTYLAKQGVLLLNSYLTVEAHKPLSHLKDEYRELLIDIISILNRIHKPIVFMLWGGNAKKYRKYLTNPFHKVIETNHPSPLSANRGGWFGSGCFKETNQYLRENNVEEVRWVEL
ncbi:MAG: uracil-DNA glycosylase [Bacilli bacterium]|nr:uracil-DNA glycosylase [Bacilli bacterium]